MYICVPVSNSGLNIGLIRVWECSEASDNTFIAWRCDIHVIDNSGFRVNLSVDETSDCFILWLFEQAYERWSNLQALQQVDLSLALREPIKNPSIYPAIALLQSLFNKWDNDALGHKLSIFDCALDNLSELRLAS